MNIIGLEILIIFILIVLNGVFAMSELAVVSARRVRLRQLANGGSRGAAAALDLAREPREFLSTVQIGITLVGILAGAFGGATIAELLSEWLASIPAVASYATTLGFVAVVLVITYFSIVVGELIPKSIALSAPERIASAVSRPMKLLSRLTSPVIWLLSTPTAAVVRLLGLQAKVEPPVTDEEIKDLISAGTEAGVFEESEQDMLERVIELESQRVTALMTPRTKVAWLDADAPKDMALEKLKAARFSRFPVARGSLDNMLGYVNSKAVLGHLFRENQIDLAAIVQRPLYVPESATVLELLEQFRDSRTHLAVVIDEFGGVEGLVTMHDLLGVIVGELANTPHASLERKVRFLDDGTVLLDGRLSVLEFKEALGFKNLPPDEEEAYQTVGGFVLARLGRIPKTGDRFSWGGYDFEIRSMDRRRVSRIAATPAVPVPQE